MPYENNWFIFQWEKKNRTFLKDKKKKVAQTMYKFEHTMLYNRPLRKNSNEGHT